MITELKSDENFTAAFLSRLLQNIQPLQGMRHRLLDQNVTSRLCRRDGYLQVHGCRVRDNHGIGPVFFESFLEICFNRIACQFILGQRPFAGTKQDDLFLPECNQIAEVSSTNRA